MQAARHSPNRLADASLLTLRRRIGGWCCIVAVLCGQIGLPNLTFDFAAAAPEASPIATADAGCQCPLTVRRVGRCCCAAKAKAAPSSCCAKKKSCRKDTADKNKVDLAFHKSCPCDQRGDIDGYRCDDPRVLPVAPRAANVAARTPSFSVADSHAYGELLPPPVPPPEFPLA
jgi:hypothetical protein